METDRNVYLKIVDNQVLALDFETCIDVENEYKTGKLYDKIVSSELWEKNKSTARLVNGEIVLGPDPVTVNESKKEYIRKIRDQKLKRCDRMSPMRWLSLTEEQKNEWINYRQALLDIPQQEGFPWDGDMDKAPWPNKPQ